MKHNDKSLRACTPLIAALLAAMSALGAQAADTVVPSAGSILQQVQPVTPATPAPSGVGLTIERADGAQLPASVPFEVKSLQLFGNSLFDTQTLNAQVADALGQTLTLPQLGALVARITHYYQAHGYPLARAIIPAQTIALGVVRVEVIEARYGQITLNNHASVSDALLHATLAPLQSGQFIAQSKVDPALLLLSDMPGVEVNASLKPGEVVGTSDLVVSTTSGPAVSGYVAVDSYGNRYTGRERLGGTVNLINPLHHGDVLSVSGLSSGAGLNYGRIGYDTLLNGQGTRLGGSWSALNYALGELLTPLNAHGTAQVASVWARQPLLRSRDVNLYGQLQFDQTQLRDHIDVSATQIDRTLNGWTLGLSGDRRDDLILGGTNTWSLGWTQGTVGFDNVAAQLADGATAKTQGSFSKWNASLVRLQNLDAASTLYLAFSGQWANTNLDSSQKMTVGGPYTVRAYDSGTLSGDSGYLISAELRHNLSAVWGGKWTVVAFVDSARVKVNQNTWVAGANNATLSGAGIGLNWSGSQDWSAKTYVATPIDSVPTLAGSTSLTRVWVEVNHRF